MLLHSTRWGYVACIYELCGIRQVYQGRSVSKIDLRVLAVRWIKTLWKFYMLESLWCKQYIYMYIIYIPLILRLSTIILWTTVLYSVLEVKELITRMDGWISWIAPRNAIDTHIRDTLWLCRLEENIRRNDDKLHSRYYIDGRKDFFIEGPSPAVYIYGCHINKNRGASILDMGSLLKTMEMKFYNRMNPSMNTAHDRYCADD